MQPHLLLRLEQAAVAALRDQQRRSPPASARDGASPAARAAAQRRRLRAAIENGDEPGVEPARPQHRQRGEKRGLGRDTAARRSSGTISPKTTETIVSEMRTVALASDSAVSG